MKINKKALELIEKGLSAKTVSKLSEGQINVLHKKMVSEYTVKTERYVEVPTSQLSQGVKVPSDMLANKQNVTVQSVPEKGITKIIPTEEQEMKEDDDSDLVNQDLTKKLTGQVPADDEEDTPNDGMDDDTDPHNNNLGSVGITEEQKKSKKDDNNPWAICTAQLGKEFGTRERHLWSAKEKNKYERCVKDVKKSLKENKNSISLFIESEILRIVEKNLPPKITKGELLKYIKEDNPTVAPPKPKKPVTKPDTKPRPKHPGQNPHPGEKESPRAEEAKKKIIKTIFKDILKK